jgi:hypothetical protein
LAARRGKSAQRDAHSLIQTSSAAPVAAASGAKTRQMRDKEVCRRFGEFLGDIVKRGRLSLRSGAQPGTRIPHTPVRAKPVQRLPEPSRTSNLVRTQNFPGCERKFRQAIQFEHKDATLDEAARCIRIRCGSRHEVISRLRIDVPIRSALIAAVKNMEFCNLRHAENSQNATPQKLDTHFIDQSSRYQDIRSSQVSPPNYSPGRRMRSNPKPAVGDMRKRLTRRCVSAATGACR